jgi:hypothetical protein
MPLVMEHSLVSFAERVVTIMFLTGLAGCASVVIISWVSIFRDGFADLKNRENESHWENSQHSVQLSRSSSSASALSG